MKFNLSALTISATTLAVMAITFIATQPQSSNDFWLQVKIGEIIASTGEIPHTLLFPYTNASSFSFNSHEWLASLLFYEWMRIGGESSLPLVLGIAGLFLFFLAIFFAAQFAHGNPALVLVCGFVALLGENFRHFLRPELLSLAFLLLYWSALERIRTHRSWFAWFSAVLVTVLWSNSHGSFVLAPAMSAVYAVGHYFDRFRVSLPRQGIASEFDFLFLTVLVTGCTLLTPLGVDMWRFVLHFSGGGSVSKYEIMEWMPSWDPRLCHVAGLWLGLSISAAVSFICLRHWRSLRSADLLLSAMFLVLGLYAVRFLVYAGFVFAFIASTVWGEKWKTRLHQRRLYLALACSAAFALAFAGYFGNMNGNFPHRTDSPEVLSAPMVSALATPSFQGNVYNSYDLGSELVYRAYPRLRPSIDSRIDSYGDSYFEFHEHLLRNEQAMSKFVHQYGVRFMLLTQSDFSLLRENQPGQLKHWHILLADSRSVFLLLKD